MHSVCRTLIAAVIGLMPCAVSIAADARPVNVETLRQALAVAKLAAKNNLPELSLRAVRESLAAGPPIQPLEFQPAASVSPRTSGEEDTYQQYLNEVESSLRELSDEWERRQFDPNAVFETLTAVVLPPGRPNELFLYPRSESASRTRSSPGAAAGGNVGSLLVRWAVRANAVDELVRRVQERAESPRGKFDARLLLVTLAIEQDRPAAAVAQLADLRQSLRSATSRWENEAAGQVALTAIRHQALSEAAADVLEAAATNLQSPAYTQNTPEPLATWLKASIAARVQLGQMNAARQALQKLAAAVDAAYSRYPVDTQAQMRRQQLQALAAELVRLQRPLETLQLLGEQADASLFESSNASQAFAVALARHLSSLSAAERYEFLAKLTLPTQPNGPVRTIVGFLPTEAPPREFLGLLPEKIRSHGFKFQETTPQPGVFHSGVVLIEAAAECGKLGELKARLKPFIDAQAPNASALQRLETLLGPDALSLHEELTNRVKQLQVANDQDPRLTAVPLDDFVVALYAVRHPELRDVGEQMLLVCLAHAKRLQQPLPRVHIWQAYVEALHRRAAIDDVAPPEFLHWGSVSFDPANSFGSGMPPNWWFADTGVVRNITSGTMGALMFRYPLTGEFEFSTTVSEGNWSEGALLFGGLSWETYRYNNQIGLAAIGRTGARLGPAGVMRDIAVDNRVTIRATGSRIDYFVNGHKVLSEDCGTSSPWLGLRSNMGWTPVFRSFTLTGRPQIPREVALLSDERLLGWVSSIYQETAPNVLPAPRPAVASGDAALDWFLNGGVLTGRQRKASITSTGTAIAESLLVYQRPLWDGEQLRYEFFYEAGKVDVHPVLDRLAFVLQPDAVRLHWLTDGSGDWTGLAADNLADDTAGQRHGGRMPLKPNSWNDLVLTVQDGSVTLRLNGTDIYSRVLPAGAMRRFGFYHHGEREEARVRNVVLSGDWPQELPADIAGSLFATTTPPHRAQPSIARQLIDEEFLSRESLHVVRVAKGLPVEERWDYLRRWVLPEEGVVRIRTQADFVPAYDSLHNAATPVPVVAPALLLVETARELSRLDALREEVADIEVAEGSYNQRAQLALLTVIDLVMGRKDAAAAELQQLSAQLPAAMSTVEWERWPVLFAASVAMLSPATREQSVLMLDYLVEQQVQKQLSSGWRFDHRVRALRGTARRLAWEGGSFEWMQRPFESRDWFPVTHGKADTISLGLPEAQWVRTPAGYRHLVGHEDDFLYFRTPLADDFEMECEVSGFGYRECQVMYAGRRVSLNYQLNELNAGEFTTPLPTRKLPQPIQTPGGWFPCKLTVQDGRMQIAFNGQLAYDEPLPRDADPWLAFHCAANSMGEMRHVRITGSPRIPEQLPLTAAGNLHGWISTYYREPANVNNPAWRQDGDEIVGTLRSEYAGSGRESLLQYHRPLLEDGELSYRFRYVPGQVHVHPALGRTVFLLEAEGVKLHDLTGGSWESSELSVDNRRSPDATEVLAAPLPLRANADNELTLALRGEVVSLALNGHAIYRGALPRGNNRIFGLFHWAGETEARVRNVVYRGDWPKKLPLAKDQELAKIAPSFQMVDEAKLSSRLTHDFTKDGLGQNLFTPRGVNGPDALRVSPEGVTVTCQGADGWRDVSLILRRQAVGDFDIQVAFDDLHTELLNVGSGGASLNINTASPLALQFRVGRRVKTGGEPVLESQLTYDGVEGKRYYVPREIPATATAGVLRAVRRGSLVHYFWKPEGAAAWRSIETIALGRPDFPLDAVLLQTSVNNGKDERVSVRWKSLSIRAEDLLPK